MALKIHKTQNTRYEITSEHSLKKRGALSYARTPSLFSAETASAKIRDFQQKGRVLKGRGLKGQVLKGAKGMVARRK